MQEMEQVVLSGDGGQATAAEIAGAYAVVCDAAGNLYIADNNSCIRKVTTSGIISTVAGGAIAGFSGDGGDATAAELFDPTGVAIDATGNLYISDSFNSRIRKVNTLGIITTFAGNGTSGYSGDGGPATAAELMFTDEITFDAAGNLYIADYQGNRIRKVNTAGIISTVAGNGTAAYGGDGGQATAAQLNQPPGVAIDASGNLYIADNSNNRIRMVCNAADNVSGIISSPSSSVITAGKVYVFRPNSIHNGLLDTAGYTTIQANGAYTFINLPYANYYIEAKADTNTYPTAVGTYYSTKANNYQWDSATFVTHRGCANTSYSDYNITVIETPGQTGMGSISGNVTANASFGHRLAGGYNNVMGAVKSIDIKLGKKPAGGCTNRTSTDAAGNYSFTQLDTGTYVVYVDIPNFTDTIVNLHVTSTNSSYTNVNYCVDSVKVHFCGSLTSGIKLVEGNYEKVTVYPNPTSNSIQVSLSGNVDNTTIEVYNTIGQRVLMQTLQTNLTQLNLGNFGNGIYQVRVLKNNTPVYQTKVVKQD